MSYTFQESKWSWRTYARAKKTKEGLPTPFLFSCSNPTQATQCLLLKLARIVRGIPVVYSMEPEIIQQKIYMVNLVFILIDIENKIWENKKSWS